MKTTTQSLAFAVIGSLLLASPLSMAASLSDRFDTYVLYNEIEAAPAGRTDPLSERFASYLLYDEIITSKSCMDPVDELLGDRFASYITPAEFTSARQSRRC